VNARRPIVHLVDGTFELFRCFHAAPRARNDAGDEVGAARGVLATITALLHSSAVTHVAVAFDSVVPPPRSRRGTSDEQLIASQVGLAADVVRALGVPVWPSGRYQADELIATAASRFAADPGVGQVVICSTDHDFHQCIRGDRVVVLDRVRGIVTDEVALRARCGVAPEQIPDLFALVGDRSDGLPGVPGWGERTAAAVLARWRTVAAIPDDEGEWGVDVRGAARLGAALRERRHEVELCRALAELRTDLPLAATLDDLAWRGAHRDRLARVCHRLGDHAVIERIAHWRA
jgi:5'-3' exonuclease